MLKLLSSLTAGVSATSILAGTVHAGAYFFGGDAVESVTRKVCDPEHKLDDRELKKLATNKTVDAVKLYSKYAILWAGVTAVLVAADRLPK